jgi:hypothetical protein
VSLSSANAPDGSFGQAQLLRTMLKAAPFDTENALFIAF